MSNIEEQSAIRELLAGVDGPVIVELGAHVGEEYGWLSAFNPSKYLMVEPDPVNCARIMKEHAAESGQLSLEQCAISCRDGIGQFYESTNHKAHNRASGSVRRPTGHLKYFPEVEFSPKTFLNHRRLDTLMLNHGLNRVDLLWVDIQGAERDMIAGGRETLARTRYMMIEAEPDVELYEGQALKPELIAMLPGWEVVRDFGYNLLMRNTNV